MVVRTRFNVTFLRTLHVFFSLSTTQVIVFKIILFLFSLFNSVTKKKLFLSINNIGVGLEPLHPQRFACDYDLQSRGALLEFLPDQRLSGLLIKAILLIHSGKMLGHYWALMASFHVIFSPLHVCKSATRRYITWIIDSTTKWILRHKQHMNPQRMSWTLLEISVYIVLYIFTIVCISLLVTARLRLRVCWPIYVGK